MKSERLSNGSPTRRTFLAACLAVGIVATITTVSGTLQASQQESATATGIVAIDVEIDKSEVLVAERFQMEITATAPQGVTVKFPELENQLGEFEVLNVKDTPDIPNGSNRKWIRRVGLESLAAGELEIPAIEISFVDRRGSTPITGLQTSPSQNVTVRSSLEGTEDPTRFRDIKSVVFLPESQQRESHWLVWAAAGLAGFLAVTAIAMVRRKKFLSPKQRAIKSLQDLKNSLACENQDVEQIYVRLVSLLRTFVQEQFAISAPRLTTLEFLEAMQGDPRLSDEFRGELSELLNLADMVKFAGLLPSGGLGEVVDQAVRLVENAAEQSPLTTDSDIPTAGDK
jgi:hypothetical protein